MDVDVDMLFVNIHYRILQNLHIAIAQFVVLVNQGLLCVLISLVGELLGLEQVTELASLVDFAEGALGEERTLDLLRVKTCRTVKDNATHLHLVLLVDVDIQNHLVLSCHIVALGNINLRVLVTLLVEIALGQNLRAVNHVGRNLRTLHNTELGLHIFALRLLQTYIINGTHARAKSQMDAEIDF